MVGFCPVRASSDTRMRMTLPPAERMRHESADETAVVATDGVFSMDGDVAPLDTLAKPRQAHKAWLVVDDAHGLGVLGANGRGVGGAFRLGADAVPVLVGTLGKAFGSFGAFVAGSRELIEFLMQKARPYIYTTALPQPVAAASRKALEIAQREPWRRERVLALTARFRKAAREAGIALLDSNTPIQPVVLGSSEAALQAQQGSTRGGLSGSSHPRTHSSARQRTPTSNAFGRSHARSRWTRSRSRSDLSRGS